MGNITVDPVAELETIPQTKVKKSTKFKMIPAKVDDICCKYIAVPVETIEAVDHAKSKTAVANYVLTEVDSLAARHCYKMLK